MQYSMNVALWATGIKDKSYSGYILFIFTTQVLNKFQSLILSLPKHQDHQYFAGIVPFSTIVSEENKPL